MDFVSRLKIFLEQRQIPITQFADNCRIPRPTLSQLLNGRNKKVSDEVIGKIHEAYPELSVMWLMFGEGSMIAGEDAPRQSSSAYSTPIINTDETDQSLESPTTDPDLNFVDLFAGGDPAGFQKVQGPQPVGTQERTTIDFPEAKPTSAPNIEISDDHTRRQQSRPKESPRHKIVNIVVLYDDGKFETFVPEG